MSARAAAHAPGLPAPIPPVAAAHALNDEVRARMADDPDGFYIQCRDALSARWPGLVARIRDVMEACAAELAARPAPVPEHFRMNRDAVENRSAKARLIVAWARQHGMPAYGLDSCEATVRNAISRAACGDGKNASADTWAEAVALRAEDDA